MTTERENQGVAAVSQGLSGFLDADLDTIMRDLGMAARRLRRDNTATSPAPSAE